MELFVGRMGVDGKSLFGSDSVGDGGRLRYFKHMTERQWKNLRKSHTLSVWKSSLPLLTRTAALETFVQRFDRRLNISSCFNVRRKINRHVPKRNIYFPDLEKSLNICHEHSITRPRSEQGLALKKVSNSKGHLLSLPGNFDCILCLSGDSLPVLVYTVFGRDRSHGRRASHQMIFHPSFR